MNRHAHAPRARTLAAAAVVIATLMIAGVASAHGFGAWGAPVNAESQIPGTSPELNTTATEGCPILSPDGLDLYMASNRTGGLGGLDIWVSHRANSHAPWGAPTNPGAPINSTVDDFCPTPTPGGGLFFVSARVVTGACGGADIYFTRRHYGTWSEPKNLGCNVNSAAGEAGPSLVLQGHSLVLYFSSTRPGGFSAEAAGAIPDADIYSSRLTFAGFAPAQLVPGLNTAADDARPNVRHDGKEIVFDSNRTGTIGGNDIYSASRSSSYGAWSTPVNLGSPINTASSESRASLSWRGDVMVFGSNRPGSEGGSNDIYVTTRSGA